MLNSSICKFLKFKLLPYIFLIIFFSNKVYADDNNYSIEKFSENSILENASINVIYQDKIGYLWFGTNEGLVQYNGYDFKVFQHILGDSMSLGSSQISDIAEDKIGNLWIATKGGGLNKFNINKGVFESYIFDIINNNTIPDNQINHIEIDNNGAIWLGFSYLGLVRFDPVSGDYIQLKLFEGQKENGINQLSLIEDQVYFSFFRGGKYCIDINNYLNAFLDRDNLELISDNDFESIIKEDVDYSYELEPDEIIFKDNSGVIWLGTTKGVYKISPKLLTTKKPIKSEQARNIVNAIAYNPKGELLLALWNEGLYSFNFQSNEHHPITTHNKNDWNITSMSYENKTSTLWIGKWKGIARMNLKNGTQIPNLGLNSLKSLVVKDIYKTEQGDFWIATWGKKDSALFKYEPKTDRLYSFKTGDGALSHVDFSAVLVDYEGAIWGGTNQHGLNKIVEHDDSVIYSKFIFDPNNENSISSNSINTIYQDTKNRLWVGTSNGLCLYDRKNKIFTNYNRENGLAEEYINSIIEDEEGALWLSTRTNISKFLPDKELFINYYQFDGIEFTFFTPQSVCKDGDGKIYFGGEGGYVTFHPDSLKINNYSPMVILTEFWLNNKPFISGDKTKDGRIIFKKHISYTDTLLLSHSDKILSFEFAALDYLHPEKIRYKYKLEGFDQNWISTDATRRYISYTNLDPGKYVFKVKSTNSHGEWNSEMAELYIEISAPFWVKWWFILLISFFTFFIIYLLQNFRLATIKRQNREVENKVIKRTRELKESYQNILTLSETGQKINASIEIQSIINSIYDQLNKLMDASIFAIGLVNRDKDVQIEYFGCRRKGQLCNEFQLPDEDKKIVEQCIEHKREFLLNNLKRNERYQSGIFMPLIKNDKLLGILIVKCNREKAYSQVQVNLLKNLVIYVISALENARSYMKILEQKKAIERFAEQEKELHEMKLHYFTEISHEFRTPLTLIKLPVQKILKSNILKREEFKELKLAEKNIDYMLKLISEVVDIEKKEISEDKLDLSITNINLNLKNIYKLFKSLAKNQDIKFIKNIHINEHVEAWLDQDKIDKILFNLLSNAFKYTNSNGTIEIRTSISKYNSNEEALPITIVNRMGKNPENNFLILIVKDTGKGIQEDEIGRIFQRYYHTENVNLFSSGIGLALTKKLIEIHKGEIVVQSEFNKGSEFTLCIPIDRSYYAKLTNCKLNQPEITDTVPITEQNQFFKLKSIDSQLPISVNKKKILIVEDNKELLNYLVTEFGDKYIVFKAENGRIGIDVAKRELPDLIVSDIMMPEVDGVELCAEIKGNIQTSHIPIILLTAKVAVKFQLSGLNAGADDYISKPFDIQILKTKIDNVINSRKLLQEKFSQEFKVEPSQITITSYDKSFLEAAIQYIEENLTESKISIDEFAEKMNMSRATLYNKINALIGKPVNEFIVSIRLKRAAQIFQTGNFSVNEVAYKTGFQAPEHFSRRFKKEFKISPLEFIKKTKSSN